jgi:hypothetical protein
MYIYENRIRKSIENYLKLGKGVRKVTQGEFDQSTLNTFWKYLNEIPLYN